MWLYDRGVDAGPGGDLGMSGSLDRWPVHIDRAAKREKTTKFDMSEGKVTGLFETEIGRLGPDDWMVYVGRTRTKSNGLPTHQANPEDPGFAVKWTKGGQSYAVGCDKWDYLFDNVREVTLWLKEERMSDNRPVETAAESFAHAALPGGEDSAHETEVIVENPYDVLGIGDDQPLPVIESRYEYRRKHAHPDQDGTNEEFIRVQKAWEQIQDERGDAQ